MRSRRTEDILVVNEDDLEYTGCVLGNGGMGCVYLYRWKTHKRRNVAVKMLAGTSDVTSLKEEAKILWGLHVQCPYILQLYGMMPMRTQQSVGLVIEYMQYGNVLDFFRNIANKVNECYIRNVKHRIAMQVCHGIDFLHNLPKPIIHRDLKARNVLLDFGLNVKICDFGLAKIQRLTSRPKSDDPSRGIVSRQGGTLSHIAPELLANPGRSTEKSDVYSFGILLWELVSEKEPYEEITNDSLLMKFVLAGKRPDTHNISGDWEILVAIMKNCWDEDPQRRQSFGVMRRRIPHSENDVEMSAALCKDAWERSRPRNDYSVTRPKTFRSADHEGTVCLNESEAERRLDNFRRQENPVSDLREGELCISDDLGLGSAASTSKEIAHTRFPDGASNEPLLAYSPAQPRNRSRRFGGWKVVLYAVAFILGCVSTFAIFWFTLYSQSAGCCINCFDLSNPLLKGNCSAMKNVRAPVGSKCNFSCPDGYILNGNTNELYCKQSGIWSGPLPYCRKIRQCRSLNPPANSGELDCTNGWYEGSKCSFQCKDGYRLRLPGDTVKALPGDFSITCNADDVDNYQWSGPEPYCEKVIQCEQLPHDDNVDVSCQPSGPGFSNGTVCHLLCKDPHMTLEYEESTTICSDDGKWNVTSEIKCLNACSSLPSPPNGEYKCNNGRKYSSTCTYSCEANFFLVGPRDVACQNSGSKRGTWSANPPACMCPSCRSGKDCENSVSFDDTWKTLNLTKNTVFDGRNISCKTAVAVSKSGNQSYGCQCKDVKTNTNKQCNDKDASTACKKAYASLLLIMSTKQICALPCDAEYMPGYKC